MTDFVNGLKSLSGLLVLTPEQSDFLHDAAEEMARLASPDVAQGATDGLREGWQLVPKLPTRAMTMHACGVLPSCEHVFGHAGEFCASVWHKMLEAAPVLSTQNIGQLVSEDGQQVTSDREQAQSRAPTSEAPICGCGHRFELCPQDGCVAIEPLTLPEGQRENPSAYTEEVTDILESENRKLRDRVDILQEALRLTRKDLISATRYIDKELSALSSTALCSPISGDGGAA